MLEDYFKPEDRRRGQDLLDKGAVVVSSASDTGARAFIRGSGACKVSLYAEDVAGASFHAACTCTSGRKGQLCKHIWAVVLKLEGSDFLNAKSEIEQAGAAAPSPAAERQQEYRKQNYERQKTRAKEIRRAKKEAGAPAAFSYPAEVEEARAYFSGNGFELAHPLELDALLQAKKQLSRVFHPDKGGTHDETVELNHHFEIISSYLKG